MVSTASVGLSPLRERERRSRSHIRNFRFLRKAFLLCLTANHDVAETEFLVDAGGYLTALACRELSSQLDYEERNHLEKRLDYHYTNRPLPIILTGQSSTRETLAAAIQTLR